MSFLNFPVGGTGCPFLRQDLAHVSRSFLLGWMVSPQKPSYLPVKDRDREPGLGGQLGEAGKASLPSACVCSLSAGFAAEPLPPSSHACCPSPQPCVTAPQVSLQSAALGKMTQGSNIFSNSVQAVILILTYPFSSYVRETLCYGLQSSLKILLSLLINRLT